MTIYSVYVINRAGGLIYQMDHTMPKTEVEKTFSFPLELTLKIYDERVVVSFGQRDGIKGKNIKQHTAPTSHGVVQCKYPHGITFRMAPPTFHSFLQKGISHWGKLDTLLYYFISNEKVVAPCGNFSKRPTFLYFFVNRNPLSSQRSQRVRIYWFSHVVFVRLIFWTYSTTLPIKWVGAHSAMLVSTTWGGGGVGGIRWVDWHHTCTQMFLLNGNNFPSIFLTVGHTILGINGELVRGRQLEDGRDVLEMIANPDNYPIAIKFGRPKLSTNERIMLASMFHS